MGRRLNYDGVLRCIKDGVKEGYGVKIFFEGLCCRIEICNWN